MFPRTRFIIQSLEHHWDEWSVVDSPNLLARQGLLQHSSGVAISYDGVHYEKFFVPFRWLERRRINKAIKRTMYQLIYDTDHANDADLTHGGE